MSKITQKEVEHVAGLARIRLTEKEKEKMTNDLASILVYFEKLNEIKTENIDPTAQVTGLENVFRKDETSQKPDGENLEKLLNQSPGRKKNFVKIKSVFKK